MLTLALLGCMAAPVLAQTTCLEDAQRAYINKRLADAIRVLDDCRSRDWPDLDTPQKTAALRLLTISHFALGAPDLARASARDLLREDRRYQANPEVDPLFFQEWIDQLRPRAWYQKRWVQIAGVTGISAVLALSTLSGEKKPLPIPPTTPPPPN